MRGGGERDELSGIFVLNTLRRGSWDILVAFWKGKRTLIETLRHLHSIFFLLLLHLIITKQATDDDVRNIETCFFKNRKSRDTYTDVVVVVVLNNK